MSNAVFPALPGLAWPIRKSPVWRTKSTESESGRQFTVRKMLYPLWHFSLPMEFLRAKAAYAELQSLVGFINARGGRFDDFLYLDPDDNTVTHQLFGVGDGATTQFQLVRPFGGFVEPVYGIANGGVSAIATSGYGGDAFYNYLSYSDQFNQSSVWLANGGSITANISSSAPDGSSTADDYNYPASTDAFLCQTPQASGSYAVGASIVFSVWLKVLTGTKNVFLAITNNAASIIYGSTTVTVTTTWQRFFVVGTVGASGESRCFIGSNNSLNGSAGSIRCWGAQLEYGSTPAPGYIKTTANQYYPSTDQYGVVTFSAPPASGAQLNWTGQFHYRCRFLSDEIPFEQFMKDLWSAKAVEFRTFRP